MRLNTESPVVTSWPYEYQPEAGLTPVQKWT